MLRAKGDRLVRARALPVGDSATRGATAEKSGVNDLTNSAIHLIIYNLSVETECSFRFFL